MIYELKQEREGIIVKNIVLITKDAVNIHYLPIYGGNLWKTPNIDELAGKGTVFQRHYTAAPSTAMAFTSMALGKNCFETERRKYVQVEECKDVTLFDRMHNLGYECHIAWDISYYKFANTHFRCYGENTILHNLDTIIPNHSPHIVGQFDNLTFDKEKENNALKIIQDMFCEVAKSNNAVFLWLHLPHVLNGRNSYASDIDLFDHVVGFAREVFQDDELYVSADHGNMDGEKGKFGYGHDVDEAAIRIPLITPRINEQKEIHDITSNLYLYDIFQGSIPKIDFAYSDSAYYLQPNRKLAIIHGEYKLIFSKRENKFYLYDLERDPNEKYNLFYPEFFDADRRIWYSLNQRFYYTKWEMAFKEKDLLLKEFYRVWKKGNYMEELVEKVIYELKILYCQLHANKNKKRIVNSWK